MSDVLVSCGSCQWSQTRPTQEAADKALTVHQQRLHGAPVLPGVVQLDPVRWRDAALDAMRSLAAKPEDFHLYDVHDYGVGEPPDPQHGWGRLAQDAHRLRIAHPVDHALSKRPATNGSSVRVWSGDASRCEKCGKAATA